MLNGKIALVTGASRGIGAAIADKLADDGARVIGTATTAEGAERISCATGGAGRPRRSARRRQPAVDRCAAGGYRSAGGPNRHSVQQRRHHPRHLVAAHEAGGLGCGA